MSERAILTIRTITLTHYDEDDYKYEETEYLKSIPLPNTLLSLYDDGDMLPLDEFTQYNVIEPVGTSYCIKNHSDLNLETDYYQKLVTKCFNKYSFVIRAEYKKPKYTKMKLTYDSVGAYHDGYCSDAECEYTIQDKILTKTVDIPDKLLGLYDDNDEIPITNKMKNRYNFNNENYSGSNYCYKGDIYDDRLNEIKECNTEYYIVREITLTN
jgi:hypothetical protein